MIAALLADGLNRAMQAGGEVADIAGRMRLLEADAIEAMRGWAVPTATDIAFALGMTLDNSIVVLESIELARRRGLDRLRSAVEGVREVWPAVLASTLTTVLVFVPVMFIEQEAGQLYSDIAIAISASILASMLVAIALIPTASARLEFGGTGRPAGSDFRDAVVGRVDKLISTSRRRTTTKPCSTLPS